MVSRVAQSIVLCGAIGVLSPWTASAQEPRMSLAVRAGTLLRVALREAVRIAHPGQPVSGTLVDPLYAYDRIVLPAGTPVTGRISALDPEPRATRVRGILAGDFSPRPHAVIRFEQAVVDGRHLAIDALVTHATVNPTRRVAAGSESDDDPSELSTLRDEATARVRDSVTRAKQRASDTLSAIERPGRLQRLKLAIVSRLPYHPQYLREGTVFDAELQAPVDFGMVTPTPIAPAGTKPAPASILKARLVSAVDSATAQRGHPIDAVTVEPVFSAGHELILPAGAKLGGQVTFARQARRLHRNGQLRFLFESAQRGDEAPTTMLAALHAVDVSADAHVDVDDEGGTKVANSSTRFVAPALALVALRGTLHHHHHHFDNDGDAVNGTTDVATQGGRAGSRGLGGYFGFGSIGLVVGRFVPPVGIALAAVGAARATYTNILGKGEELRFAAGTPIQVQLAPGPLQPDR